MFLGEAKLRLVNPISPLCSFGQAMVGRGQSHDVGSGEFESLDWEGRFLLVLT
jgi:hypothetical protein